MVTPKIPHPPLAPITRTLSPRCTAARPRAISEGSAATGKEAAWIGLSEEGPGFSELRYYQGWPSRAVLGQAADVELGDEHHSLEPQFKVSWSDSTGW